MKLDFVDFLFEGTDSDPRIAHPEDSIFQGSAVADRSLKSLLEIISKPQDVTIKWDGQVALFFGRTARGEFFISDKYMYPRVEATSIQQWIEYDNTKASKKLRPDLYEKLRVIWSALEQVVPQEPAVFKGDLMFVGQLQPQQGNYVFKGPTVTYTIPTKSPIGQAITGKVGLIVVHSMNNQPWDGRTGLRRDGAIAILDPNAGNTFKLAEPIQLVSQARRALSQYGGAVDTFLGGLTGTATSKIQTYFNKKITRQTNDEISDWLRVNDPAQYKKLIGENQDGYLYQNIEGFNALKTIWNSIYQLKVSIGQQLESQIKNVAMTTTAGPGGEGFVFPTSSGNLLKLVNRGVFGAAHFNQ